MTQILKGNRVAIYHKCIAIMQIYSYTWNLVQDWMRKRISVWFACLPVCKRANELLVAYIIRIKRFCILIHIGEIDKDDDTPKLLVRWLWSRKRNSIIKRVFERLFLLPLFPLCRLVNNLRPSFQHSITSFISFVIESDHNDFGKQVVISTSRVQTDNQLGIGQQAGPVLCANLLPFSYQNSTQSLYYYYIRTCD